MKAITFFEENREPTPNKPNKIITGVVDDNAEIYIIRLQKENKQLKKQLDVHKILLQTNAPSTCILTELEEWLKENQYYYNATGRKKRKNIIEVLDKIQELKEKYK